MTLDDMIQETCSYIDETLTKSGNQYTDVSTFNILKSAINYAYKKICREKFKLLASETVNIVDGKIDINTLSKNFLELYSISDSEGNEIDYSFDGDIISIPDADSATVNYYYMPDELINLSDEPFLPSAVDHKILCYYAAFQYLNIEDDERAAKWLPLWNDGFESIKQSRQPRKIKSIYNVGW